MAAIDLKRPLRVLKCHLLVAAGLDSKKLKRLYALIERVKPDELNSRIAFARIQVGLYPKGHPGEKLSMAALAALEGYRNHLDRVDVMKFGFLNGKTNYAYQGDESFLEYQKAMKSDGLSLRL
jgi:hypothetical protein